MSVENSKNSQLSALGGMILKNLELVANAAKFKLDGNRNQSQASALMSGANSMVGNPAAQNLMAILGTDRSDLQRLSREPFVARIVIQFEVAGGPPQQSVFYITRPSAPTWDVIDGARFATYTAPLGRIAEVPIGTRLKVPFSGTLRNAVIVERVRLTPDISSRGWDALNDRFEFADRKVKLDSILLFLDELERSSRTTEADIPDLLGELLRQGAEASLQRDRLRRRALDRIALRDQPILDEHQGEVFRLPLNQRLVLLGPPGSGKTTTLIRRLAQKRKIDTLSDEEKTALDAAGINNSANASSWVMFTPTELLKLYLRDAFNQEGVPAAQENLRTWDKERVRLGRNALNILRSGESPGFQIDDSVRTLIDASSDGTVMLFREFADFLERTISEQLTTAYGRLTTSDIPVERSEIVRRTIGRSLQKNTFSILNAARLLDGAPLLQDEVRKLSGEIDAEAQRLGNRLLRNHSELPSELTNHIEELLADDRSEDDDEDDDSEEAMLLERTASQLRARPEVAAQFLIDAIRRLAAGRVAKRAIGGRAGLLIKVLGTRVPPEDELIQLGEKILTRMDLRALMRAPRLYVTGVRSAFSRFRRERIREGSLFRAEAVEFVRQRKITSEEVDVLILTMLRNARRLLRENGWRFQASNEWMEKIVAEHQIQVFVDEATDFSAVQLACTMELTHPRLRSWFACGDFNQRITSYGIQHASDFGILSDEYEPPVQIRTIQIGYRQSPKLTDLAAALCADPTSAPTADLEVNHENVMPLLVENHAGAPLAKWLSNRIVEIERSIGSLPSIALFVDGEAEISRIVTLVRPLLSKNNIQIVGYPDGRAVGDEQEVRVFDIQHIKGLEFEAVFFIGVDKLALRLEALFDRYFYVGVSRAATYLGITCENSLPQVLESVRSHFQDAAWA